MKWENGRQANCNYKKLCIFSFKILNMRFDAYLLKYEAPGFLPKHKDPVKNGAHHRLNISFYGFSEFQTQMKGTIHKRFIFFRPDIDMHSLTIYTPTLKLSLGYVKYK